MHDFETIEKSYFTIDFIFAGSIALMTSVLAENALYTTHIGCR